MLNPLRGTSVTQITVDFRPVVVIGSDWEVVLEHPSISHTIPFELSRPCVFTRSPRTSQQL